MKAELTTSFTDVGGRKITRILKSVSLAEIVGAPHLKLPRHLHHLAGFCLILHGAYVESYGKTELECQPCSFFIDAFNKRAGFAEGKLSLERSRSTFV